MASMSQIRPVSAVGSFAGNVIKTPFLVVGALASGTTKGIAASKAGDLISLGLSKDLVYVDNLWNLFANSFKNLFSNGLFSLREQGIASSFGGIFRGGTLAEMGEAIKLFGSKLAGLSGRGMVLLGGNVVLGAFAVVAGLKLLYSAYKNFSELSKGFRPLGERVMNPFVHLTQAAFAGAAALGGILCFTPAGALGAALAVAGAAGAFVIGKYKDLAYGDTWINRPSTAPFPISWILNVFKNDIFHSY